MSDTCYRCGDDLGESRMYVNGDESKTTEKDVCVVIKHDDIDGIESDPKRESLKSLETENNTIEEWVKQFIAGNGDVITYNEHIARDFEQQAENADSSERAQLLKNGAERSRNKSWNLTREEIELVEVEHYQDVDGVVDDGSAVLGRVYINKDIQISTNELICPNCLKESYEIIWKRS